MQEVIAHIDGGSRGNPGPAACAVVLHDAGGSHLASFSRFLGLATNNVAEYQGLLAALKYAIEHHYTRLRVVSDSELLTRHITGQYKVKDSNLKVLYEQARALIAQLDSFSIKHVLREQNREADRLANQALDATESKKPTPQQPDSAPAATKTIWVAATYRQGILKPHQALPLADGEEVYLKIERKS